ncbi:MAG: transaldolase [Francisellaceae bacterium]
MMNKLEQLKTMTKVVADTGDFAQIKQYHPQDATTNPSLLLNAAMMPEYAPLFNQSLRIGESLNQEQRLKMIMMDLAVRFGVEILKIVPGKVSTEVDARLSFDSMATLDYARSLIKTYEDHGIGRERVLIKIASTWEGIVAAAQLQHEGINCNLTLMFDITQAIACAEAGVYLISPFVGRITDWYMKHNGQRDFPAVDEDQGVKSVKEIYHYYKSHGYNTIVMGASFRHAGQIEALAGCDALTISPALLSQLAQDQARLKRVLSANDYVNKAGVSMDEKAFRWAMNDNAMASEKLAEGIRKFAADTVKLEAMIKSRLG